MPALTFAKTGRFIRKHLPVIVFILCFLLVSVFVTTPLSQQYQHRQNQRFESDAITATLGIFAVLWVLLIVYFIATRSTIKQTITGCLTSLFGVIPFYCVVHPFLLALLYVVNLVTPGVSRQGHAVVSMMEEPETVQSVRDLSSGEPILLGECHKTLRYADADYGDTIQYTVHVGLLGLPRYSSFTRLSTGTHSNK
ncbi:MAG: hypothetical protein EOO88_01125 [Pedobacter sp.]|nr:MAG: hypothetical protein EOO88_01125 [Pedobacter sp.]